jgi:zinc transport system permease protein
MLDDFLVRGLIAGSLIALVVGPLGCFVVWRRMAFFGDALSHSALLGVALGIVVGIAPGATVIIVCVGFAVMLYFLERDLTLSSDTILGISAHTALALGVVTLSFNDRVRVDLMSYLFGDILAVTPEEISWILLATVAVAVALIALWRPLLAVTVHADLAEAEGVAVGRVRLGFVLMMAVVVALGMQVVGVLLITSLLIVPAAAARRVASTPELMALASAMIAVLAVCLGLASSMRWDTPAGPSIVVSATALFFFLTLARALRKPTPRPLPDA